MRLFYNEHMLERLLTLCAICRLPIFIQSRDDQPHQKRFLVIIAHVLKFDYCRTRKQVLHWDRRTAIEHLTLSANHQTGESRLKRRSDIHRLLGRVGLATDNVVDFPIKVA